MKGSKSRIRMFAGVGTLDGVRDFSVQPFYDGLRRFVGTATPHQLVYLAIVRSDCCSGAAAALFALWRMSMSAGDTARP
jgi:hypothetical protein